MVGGENAFKLFNIYTRSADCRQIGVHYCSADNSYRVRFGNGTLSTPLCYRPEDRGTVVLQTILQPAQQGDVHRFVLDANLLPPVFFVHTSGAVGISIPEVLNSRPNAPIDSILNPNEPARLGGHANTTFRLWVRSTTS